MKVCHADAFHCKTVQIGRVDFSPKGRGVAEAKVIGDDDEEVWAFRCGHRGGVVRMGFLGLDATTHMMPMRCLIAL